MPYGLTHVATASYIFGIFGNYFSLYMDSFCCEFLFTHQGVHQEVKFDEHHLRTGEKDSRRND